MIHGKIMNAVVLLVGFIAIAVASLTTEKRRSTTVLSNEQVSAYKPYPFYAAAAFCRPANTKAWDC